MTDILRIKRGKDKSLRVTEDIKELMKPVHFEATKQQPTPPKVENALEKIKSVELYNNTTNGAKDMVWCLLRMICRGILPVNNNDTEQVIPLWRGYNSHVIELSEYVTVSSGLTPINHTP